jgi:8-oxo-dGTP pyrophosphatase MutT (NUDIX family)
MYVIFKDHASVILSDRSDFSEELEALDWTKENLEKVLLSLGQNEGRSFLLQGDDPDNMWQVFAEHFTVIEAAGGIVKNKNGEYLLIYRHDTWDLPKGKIDPGETPEEAAMREVREECGFSILKLGSQLQNTYHIYEHQEKQILKVTYWYLMHSDQKVLKPQLEEGITDLDWKSVSDLQVVFENTYPNIERLLKEQILRGA